jgi:hypothetical protein
MTLPAVGTDPRSVWPSKLNAHIAALAARVETLGGGAMTAPLPVIGNSEDTWGAMLNAYLTEMDGRVTTVESGGSGYDVGGYGDVYGDGTVVPSGAYTVTSNGLYKPNTGIIGWGALENTNIDLVETLTNRIVVLEEAMGE